MVTVSQAREEFGDREAIRDCLFRYCRGIDRFDAELIRSAYWPGAMDYHTGFEGTVEQFIEWALPRLAAMEQNVHMLGNILIRIDGNRANAESYFWSVSVLVGEEPRQVHLCGRYLDTLEKRGDDWRIAERIVVHDWFNDTPAVHDWNAGPFGMSGLLRGVKAPDDRSSTFLRL